MLPEDGDRFFAEVQADYEAVTPETRRRRRAVRARPTRSPTSAPRSMRRALPHHGTRRYAYDITYTADSYIALLETYSGHRALDERRRARLLELIRARIASRPAARCARLPRDPERRTARLEPLTR